MKSGGDKHRHARDHFRVAQDAAVSEAGGADELRAVPDQKRTEGLMFNPSVLFYYFGG
ncbi:MAG TPA: hypothetical protein VLE49_18955 [Anaerolineales bacterium]|nr:hypothetical protein [Anaerolineales bacterium]